MTNAPIKPEACKCARCACDPCGCGKPAQDCAPACGCRKK